ncbi:putative reverse transcriptase domain-containing protein [Tanacetum coccineum]
MAPTTRRGPNTPVNNTNPNNMTPESIQAMIDQALLQNSTNGDGTHSSHEDNRRHVQTARPCYYADFMKYQPLNFKGTEGVVASEVSLFASVQGEIKKLEIELWNLKVKGNDVPAYTERFQELTLICTKFVANETKKETMHLRGKLSDNNVRLLIFQKQHESTANTPSRGQNVAQGIYNNREGKKKPYGGSLLKCTKCHLHHNGPCTQKCHKCNKVGHFARDCRNTGNTNVANTQKGNGAAPKGNGCFECGALGHFKRDCPKLKNKDEEMDKHKAGFMQLGMQKGEEMHRETRMPMSSRPGRAFWGADDEEISEGGIPRVIVLGYDGLPMQPAAPPLPDYILGPEDPQIPPVPQDEDERQPMFVQAHDPDYIPEPIYPEYIPLEDEHEFPAEEQPLPLLILLMMSHRNMFLLVIPRVGSEEYEDDETEEGPVDYHIDGGDDGDDDDGDSSEDDADDEDEGDEDEEEEHLALADSAIIVPVDEPVFPPEGTSYIYTTCTDHYDRRLGHYRPGLGLHIPSPTRGKRFGRLSGHGLPITHHPISLSPPLYYCRITSPPLPPLPPSLYIPPHVDHRDDISCLSNSTHEGTRDVGYGIRDTWVDLAEAVLEIAPMAVGEVNTRVTELVELHEHDNTGTVMDGGGGGLCFPRGLGSLDRIESGNIGASDPFDHVYVRRTHLSRHNQTQYSYAVVILFRHNIRRQAQMVETLRVIRDMRREMSDMQAELLALREPQRRARQSGPEARIPDHQEASGDADSHI